MSWQPGWTLEQVEEDVIDKALRFFGGNKVRTAAALGIAERTLYNKLESYERRKNGDTSTQTSSGLRMEPVIEVATELPLPLRKQVEVQEMPQGQASRMHSTGSGRKAKSIR